MDWYEQAKPLRISGWTYPKIADLLNIPLKTVQSRFKRDEMRGNVISTKEGKEEIKPKVQEFGDYYIVSSGKHEIKVTKSKLREIKVLYCDTKIEINTLCRQIDIPRRDFFIVKNAFSITHDDVPALDEELTDSNIDSLVQESIERRKANYFIKLQQEEVKALKQEVENYRRQDYYIDRIDKLIINKRIESPTVLLLPKVNSKEMLEVSTVDLHLGKLAWKPETGSNYDCRIAEKKYMSVIYDIVSRIQNRQFEKIIFPVGNDFFNFDTIEGTTTGGTHQDNDLRWQKLFDIGIDIIINSIDILSKYAPIESFVVPGNHDKMTSYYAIKTIAAHFRNNENVHIDTSPQTRKYIEYGKCLIGFTHGDKEKNRIFGNMQVEAPEQWGRTKYREWHLGHLHSEQVKELHGVKVRNLTSITGTDAWHFESGYVGSILTSQSFIWNSEKGLQEIIYSNVEV